MKKIKYIIISFLLVLTFSIQSFAAENLEIGVGQIAVAENIMEIQVVNSINDASHPITYEISVDGTALPLVSVENFAKADMATSYVFMVDISGSMKDDMMAEVKALLSGIVDLMEDKDNACVMLVGDTINSGEFLEDKEALLKAIEAIEISNEDTNLYLGIDKALDILDTSNQVKDRACLVVLSDGRDDQMTGITLEEVEKKIEEKRISICTLATIGNKPNQEKKDFAKLFGSLARLSPGGIHHILGSEEITAGEAAAEIVNQNLNSVIIKADVTGFESTAVDSYLEVSAQAEGIGTAVDGYKIQTAVIKKGLVEIVEEIPTEIAEEVEDEKDNTTMIFITGIVLLILIIVMVVLTNKKKKENNQTEKEENPSVDKIESDVVKEDDSLKKTTAPLGKTREGMVQEPKPVLKIKFVKIGLKEKEEKELEIAHSFIIGRKKETCDLAFADDSKISSKHFKFSYDGKELWIEDLESLNGTLINGVAIKQRFKVTNGDIVSFGSNEWRVVFSENEEETK